MYINKIAISSMDLSSSTDCNTFNSLAIVHTTHEPSIYVVDSLNLKEEFRNGYQTLSTLTPALAI